MQYINYYNSPLGRIILLSNGEELTGLQFEGKSKYYSLPEKGKFEIKNLPVFEQTEKWLDIYFDGKEPGFTPPLCLSSTPFRTAVWDILLIIPYATVTTYGEIARIIAKKNGINRMSAQAVGGAVGHNPIPIIVPCHRVVGANGSLTGYACGLDLKQKLLTLENVDMSKLFFPKSDIR